MINCKFARNQC